MKRFGVGLAVLMAIGLALAVPAQGAYKAPHAVKIDVMGEWAHPDDDTSIIGPCGVWHERYGVRCGIIMVTRGEGGGNAVGTEIGPPLGLRRENEDRVAHYRSGTVDIFNLDRVDFFYNQSAPLTQYFWGERRDAAAGHADHPHDPAGDLHRLHAVAQRRPRQPPAGRPLHLGGRPGGGRPDDVPRAAARAAQALDTGRSRRSSPAAASAGTGGTTTAPTAPPASSRVDQPRHGGRRLDRLRLAVSTGRPATSRASRRARRRSGRRSRRRARAPTRRRAGRCSWATRRRAARASARPTRSSRSSPT